MQEQSETVVAHDSSKVTSDLWNRAQMIGKEKPSIHLSSTVKDWQNSILAESAT